jgi:exodeoxyribonuclease VII small subunit
MTSSTPPEGLPEAASDEQAGQLDYEQAFGELESIVAALESGDRSLDETLALFERGQWLARYCAGLLDKAELKVQQLSGDTLSDISPGSTLPLDSTLPPDLPSQE